MNGAQINMFMFAGRIIVWHRQHIFATLCLVQLTRKDSLSKTVVPEQSAVKLGAMGKMTCAP